MADYTVRIPVFEGPMDLLMHLIERDKIDIYDIPIADLTRQYLLYLDQMREFNMEVTSAFLVMAATLLQIKSRMMLPKPEKEKAEGDPRLELVMRILEYRKFKQVSAVLGDMAEMEGRFVARAPMPLLVHHLPPGNMSLQQLVDAFRTVLAVKKELRIPKALVAPEAYSVQDKMEEILSLLMRHDGTIRFLEAFQSSTRSALITTFLALLELIKRKAVRARQAGHFAELIISVRKEK